MTEKSGSKAYQPQRVAMSPPSLSNSLDQERAASMADEGGASGAEMESQETESWRPGLAAMPPSQSERRMASGSPRWLWIAGVSILGAFALYFAFRKRSAPAAFI